MSEMISVTQLSRELERGKAQIAAALPRHLTPERMIRLACTTFQRTPELAECDLKSILGCVVQASQLGLEFDSVLGHAYLVPFNNRQRRQKECQLVVGYKGFISLAFRTGKVTSFSAHVVHEADEFDYSNGTHGHVRHKQNLKEESPPIACFACISLGAPLGAGDQEIWPWWKILQWQKRYQRTGKNGEPYGPWAEHLEEMARKTLIRCLAKRSPISVELQRAASLDEYAESGIAQNLAALVDSSRTAQIRDRLEERLASRPTAANGDQPVASSAQLEQLAKLLREAGLGEEEYNERCHDLGCNPNSLLREQAGELIRWLEELLAERQAASREGA